MTATAEQIAADVQTRRQKQDADHADRLVLALDQIEVACKIVDGDECDFEAHMAGMTIKGYVSFDAEYDEGDVSVGIGSGWEIGVAMKQCELNFGLGIKIADVPHESPIAAAILQKCQEFLDGEHEGREPDNGRDD